MVKFLSLALFLFISVLMYSQVPQGIPYQAVIRDTQGNSILNQSVSVKFSLHDQTSDGTVVYEETHTTSTNEVGLFSLTFGAGVPSIGTFTSINWSSGYKFLQVQTDIGNGFVDNGTQQLMSVPYALFSGKAAEIESSQPLEVGQEYQGGKIFYLDKTGQHGFVMADTTIYCPNCILPSTGSNNQTASILQTANGMFSGRVNTTSLSLLLQSEIGGSNVEQNIFKIVTDLSFNGFNDWFIPSWSELLTAYWSLHESTNFFNPAFLTGNTDTFQGFYSSSFRAGENSGGAFNHYLGFQNGAFNPNGSQPGNSAATISYVKIVREF
jgi:hypothetical protein